MGKYIRLITFLGKAKKETAVKTTISLAVVALSFTQAFFLAQGVSAVFAQEELQTVFTWFLLCLAALLARAWILRFQEGYTKKKMCIRDRHFYFPRPNLQTDRRIRPLKVSSNCQ